MSPDPTETSAELPYDQLSFLGFGEAAQAVAAGWRQDGPALGLAAFDLKTSDPDAAASQAKWRDYVNLDVAGGETIGDALGTAPLVVSLVTADQAHDAACAAAGVMRAGAVFLDGNSCSPGTKQRSAAVLEQAGCRYLDCAIMSPIHPRRQRTPMLISGPHATALRPRLAALGLDIHVAGDGIGRASAIKMLRSVMVKGIEALVLEGLVAARKAGVEDAVITSLQATFPGLDWRAKAAYDLERTTTHGLRRSAEMHEVMQTLTELGSPNDLSRAIADWQARAGALGLTLKDTDFAARADAVLAALEDTT